MYSSSLRAKLLDFNRNQVNIYYGMSEGDFDDENSLVEAVVGSKHVYTQKAKIINKGATVVLLLDESGSMGSNYSTKAREIAVLFERALVNQNNIDYYCYGHTTGSLENTVINVYYEGRKKSNPQILGNIAAYAYNRDGHAILEVIGRVRKKTQQHIVMFVVSDGQPSASIKSEIFNGTLVEYTKNCVDAAEKQNVSIIHVAIKPGVPSKNMFKNYVTFSNFDTLINDIGRLLVKIIAKIQMPETEYL
jgi:nitric oxide reductase activation protein